MISILFGSNGNEEEGKQRENEFTKKLIAKDWGL